MNTKFILLSIILLVSLTVAADLSKYNLMANESYIYIHRVTSGSEAHPNNSTDWNYNTEILLKGYLKAASFSSDDPSLVATYSLEDATVTWRMDKISHLTSGCTNISTVQSSGTEKLENLQFLRAVKPDGTLLTFPGNVSFSGNQNQFIPLGKFNLRLYSAVNTYESTLAPRYEAETGFVIFANNIWTTTCQPVQPVSKIYDSLYLFAPLLDPIPLNTNILNGSMTVPAGQVEKDPRIDTSSTFGFYEETLYEPSYETYENPLIWYVEWRMYMPDTPTLNILGITLPEKNVSSNKTYTPPEKNNLSINSTNTGNNVYDPGAGNNVYDPNTGNSITGNNTNKNSDPCVMKDCILTISSPGPNGTTDVTVSDPNGPVPDTSVTVADPQGNEKIYTTDNNGVAHINFNSGSGNYILSAGNKTINYQPPRQLFDDTIRAITDSNSAVYSIIILIIIIVLVALYLRLRQPQQLPPKTK